MHQLLLPSSRVCCSVLYAIGCLFETLDEDGLLVALHRKCPGHSQAFRNHVQPEICHRRMARPVEARPVNRVLVRFDPMQKVLGQLFIYVFLARLAFFANLVLQLSL